MISPIAAAFEQALQRGDANSALTLADQRIAQAPQDGGAWHLRGHALDALDRLPDAEAAFLHARTLAPQWIQYRFSLAGMCFMRGDWQRAARHFRACIEVQPLWKDAWANLARAELKLGNNDAAFDASTRAAELPPDEPTTLKLQSVCAGLVNVPAPVMLAIRQKILQLTPSDAEAHFQVAMAHEALRNHADMHACLRRCLELEPNYLTARWISAQIPVQGHFQSDAERSAYLEQWRSGMAAIEALPLDSPLMRAHCEAIMQTYPNFYLAYLGGVFREEQQRYATLVHRIATRVCGDLQVGRRRIERSRRRIGVISGMLQQHSVTKLFMPAFTGLDRSRFEVIGFCPRNVRDAWTDRYERELDGFHIGTASPRQWAQTIAACDLDILVYLDVGMFALTSSLAALRLAPVQAVLWGHPFTTGLKEMDWFITSAAMEPAEHAHHYSEKTLMLPGMGCVFDPPEFALSKDNTQEDSGAEDTIYAACLQNGEKLSPKHDALFVRLLQSVPNLHLSFTPGLMPEGRKRFMSRFQTACAAQGVDFAKRVTVHGWLQHAQFANIISRQHFILDALDWSGGVTALETFWLDKPILTLPGALMRGRHTYAMLKRMQVDELIAYDEADYLDRAIRLANDSSWRKSITEKIRANKQRLYRDSSVIEALSHWLGNVQPD